MDSQGKELPASWISVLPLIGCDRSLDGSADVIAIAEKSSLTGALASLEDLIVRAAALAWNRISPGGTDLLAFLAIRNRSLNPTVHLDRPKALEFQECARFPDLERQAASLANKGYLAVKQVEIVNDCPGCGSARLLVREVCSSCNSSDVVDENILHHFDCAYQGPESSFHKSPILHCPKCCNELTSFGIDYDKPAIVTFCRNCGQTNQDPAIGFRCMDCGVSDRAEKLIARRLYAYRLTEAGLSAVTRRSGEYHLASASSRGLAPAI